MRSRNHELKMKLERNQQVFNFRTRLLYELGADIIEFMPSYNEMCESDKPLVASEWVDIDSFTLTDLIAINEPLRIERGMMVVYNAN